MPERALVGVEECRRFEGVREVRHSIGVSPLLEDSGSEKRALRLLFPRFGVLISGRVSGTVMTLTPKLLRRSRRRARGTLSSVSMFPAITLPRNVKKDRGLPS